MTTNALPTWQQQMHIRSIENEEDTQLDDRKTNLNATAGNLQLYKKCLRFKHNRSAPAMRESTVTSWIKQLELETRLSAEVCSKDCSKDSKHENHRKLLQTWVRRESKTIDYNTSNLRNQEWRAIGPRIAMLSWGENWIPGYNKSKSVRGCVRGCAA